MRRRSWEPACCPDPGRPFKSSAGEGCVAGGALWLEHIQRRDAVMGDTSTLTVARTCSLMPAVDRDRKGRQLVLRVSVCENDHRGNSVESCSRLVTATAATPEAKNTASGRTSGGSKRHKQEPGRETTGEDSALMAAPICLDVQQV